MAATLEEYRSQLIQNVLASSSSHEVAQYIKTAIKSLRENKVHDYVIDRFVMKTILQLQKTNSLVRDPHEIENIQTATFELYKLQLAASGID